MIYLGSRYQSEPVITLHSRDGSVSQFVLRGVSPVEAISPKTYSWKSSDRIDQIAEKFLGSSTQWWRIMDVNPTIADPFSIAVGTVVNLP